MIYRKRCELGYTLKIMAERMGHSTIANLLHYLKGDFSISYKTIVKIANALDLEISALEKSAIQISEIK
jgi:transcriptional regulator with XRE-family HTH domain